jgi:hypothetical protein
MTGLAFPEGSRSNSLPNWCRNYAIISGSQEQVDWLTDSISDFNKICPQPRANGRGRSKEASWHQKNWGCDRNVDPEEVDIARLSENMIVVRMPTAWTPPTGIYSSLVQSGFSLEVYYFEPGLELIGFIRDREHTPLSVSQVRKEFGTPHQFVVGTDIGQALHRYLGFPEGLE